MEMLLGDVLVISEQGWLTSEQSAMIMVRLLVLKKTGGQRMWSKPTPHKCDEWLFPCNLDLPP